MRGIYCWLRKNLVGGKILAIEPCDRKSIFLTVRKSGLRVFYIVISWDAAFFRLYPTSTKPRKADLQNPFLGIMKRHLQGARIASIVMKSLERVVTFELVNIDLSGNEQEFTLIAELMGKNSNLILIDRETREIIDAGKHVTEAMSRLRPVLPGEEYVEPPVSQGQNPLAATEPEIAGALGKEPALRLDKRILNEFSGISPTTAREIAFRTEREPTEMHSEQAAAGVFASMMSDISEERFEPCIMTEPEAKSLPGGIGQKSILCAFPLLSKEGFGMAQFDTMAAAAETFFAAKEAAASFEKMAQRLAQMVRAKLTKAKRRLVNVESETVDENEVNRLFMLGELLKVNVRAVKKGMDHIEVEDILSGKGESVSIKLDGKLSAWANVDVLFKKAKKAKRRLAHSENLFKSVRAEISYLEDVLLHVESCEDSECLRQIAEELLSRGEMSERKFNEIVTGVERPASEERPEPYRRFISSDGFEILVGRNNAENDQLTLRTARPYDLFVHAQGIPGSHVIIWRSERNSPIPKRTIEEAAIISALHSKSRGALHVPVDYTPRSQVKKPKGSIPGKVIYTSFETIFVDPDESILKNLSKIDLRRTQSGTKEK
ncbi:MAG: NFACT family protein [Candidatus Coatesbacteria bacterium]|nr:NFACT family protein [Candidatus Coatesbacteria bacterium]